MADRNTHSIVLISRKSMFCLFIITTLELLSSTMPDLTGAHSAVRVFNSSEADIIFVPFFSALSYNRHFKGKPHQKRSKNKLLQEKLVRFLTSQEEWKRSGGRDHIVMAHHPNSMLDARTKLWLAMFILSDFGRYPPNIANVEKDVIAAYKHVIRTFVNDSSGYDDRPTSLYSPVKYYLSMRRKRSCCPIRFSVLPIV